MLIKVGTNHFTVERKTWSKKLALHGKFRETIEFDEDNLDELIELLMKAKVELLQG